MRSYTDRQGTVLLDWIEPRVARVTINRPEKRNACDQKTWQGIDAALAEAAARPSTRLAVLTGAGGHFCAGDDIGDAAAARQEGRQAAYARDIEQAFQAVVRTPFPVVAAISGYCIGGGLSLAMCCDFRVGTPDAELGIPAAKLGFTYPAWQCSRLMTLVGLSQARRMLFAGNRVDGHTARAIGLFDSLTEADPAAAALALAGDMLDSAPLSVQASKRIFQALAVSDLAGQQAEIDALTRRVEESADLREGALAFAQKRRPVFAGQ